MYLVKFSLEIQVSAWRVLSYLCRIFVFLFVRFFAFEFLAGRVIFGQSAGILFLYWFHIYTVPIYITGNFRIGVIRT